MASLDTELNHKPYEAPAIVYETKLEVRAGTPLGLPDALDLIEPRD